MKAAFSPPPPQADAPPPGEIEVEEALLGGEGEPQAQPLVAEVATEAKGSASQPGPAAGGKPISPSLLEPLDSNAAEVVKQKLEQPPKERKAAAAQAAAPPPTPAAGGEATPRRSRPRRGPAPKSDSTLERPPRHSAAHKLLSSGGAVEGADSLEVRSVTLANGQQASLILEEGKLQRIVAANGQVAELRWNAPERGGGERASGPQRLRHLAVKLHRGATPGSTATGGGEGKPGALKRWANSLNSQRLTTGSGAPFRKDSLMSAPGGWGGLNSRERQGRHSVDLGGGSRRGRFASLFSLPGSKAGDKEGAGASEMPTILETQREVQKAWNPMHESWLPSTMTTQVLHSQEAGRQSGSRKQLQTAPTNAPQGGGGGGGGAAQTQHSMDLITGMSGLGPEGTEGRPAIHSGHTGQMTAIYDSDPGYSDPGSKGQSRLWRALKRLLHLPSVSKPRSPRAGGGGNTPRGTPRAGGGRGRGGKQAPATLESTGKLRSFGLQSIRRLSQGFGGSKAKAVADLRDEDFAADPLGSNASPLGSLPETPAQLRSVGSETDILRPKAGSPQAELDALGRGRQADSFVPPTPQQQQPGRGARGQAPSPAEARPSGESDDIYVTPPPVSSSAAPRLTNADLIDTAELRAALASRRSARAAAREAGGDDGRASADGRPKSRGRRLSDALERLPRQRTMMAGRWRKNFTEGTSGAKVDELLQVSSLQRLARERIVEMEIVEGEETFELHWHIPLNGSSSKISKTDRYLKNGEVVEGARRDGRAGVLRSQLTFTPEGHVHIRALQGEPFSAVFHDRIKLSTGGRRIKLEQKFQLLQPGVLPVKHHSIWTRVE